MSVERFSLDSDVLLASVDFDAGSRHERAIELVREAAVEHECILTAQALAEFFAAATSEGRMPADVAARQVQDWRTIFPTAELTAAGLGRGLGLAARHGLATWDALQVAAASEAGVTVLLSSRPTPVSTVAGVEIRHPFREGDPFAGAGRPFA